MSTNTETTGADRTKCKAWCGYLHGDTSDPRRAAYMKHVGEPANWGDDKRAYCSPACRDAHLPPIAAPAAHIERRKGQVEVGQLWRAASKQHRVMSVNGDYVTTDVGGGCRFHGPTMLVYWTLLADAPPAQEAPPPGVILQGTNDGQTWTRCASSFGCSHRQHRAAREAPKAAPVCKVKAPGGCRGPLLMRHVGAVGGLMCESCMLNLEAKVSDWTGSGIAPYHGPERLPRPQLAADWVEDCLPESDR